MTRFVRIALVWIVSLIPAAGAERVALDHALKTIKAVGPEGTGNAAASAAWKQLADRDASAIVPILSALRDANPLAANYLRSAVDAIAEREIRSGSLSNTTELESFLKDTGNEPRARRLAFEILVAVDPKSREKWTSQFLTDPSHELRRDAVAHWLALAKAAMDKGEKDAARPLYEKALTGAVDEDQVKGIAKILADLGKEVDVPTHFGLIQNWKVIGPFDNREEKGFHVAYPPEARVDFEATCEGVDGQVAWNEATTTDPMGAVDLNKLVANKQGVAAYAAHVFTLDQPRRVWIRLGTPNGWKLWVNGKLIFERDEYHSGHNFDQFALPVEMVKGENLILVKCCQNEQPESWAKDWKFQLRVSDLAGGAVLSTSRPLIKSSPAIPVEEAP